MKKKKNSKIEALKTLEELKKASPINGDYEKEREEAAKEKYGIID